MFRISKEGSDFQSHPDCQYPALLLNHVFHDFSKFSVKKKWGAWLGFGHHSHAPILEVHSNLFFPKGREKILWVFQPVAC